MLLQLSTIWEPPAQRVGKAERSLADQQMKTSWPLLHALTGQRLRLGYRAKLAPADSNAGRTAARTGTIQNTLMACIIREKPLALGSQRFFRLRPTRFG